MSNYSLNDSQSGVHAGSPPDWSKISSEFHCPLCEYNLRGLIEPRCPECGYRFTWDRLLNLSSQYHPYLMEHHTERPIRAFWRTLRGGLLIRRFWKTLMPEQTVYPRLILAYAIAVAFAAFVAQAAAIGLLIAAVKLAVVNQAMLPPPPPPNPANFFPGQVMRTQQYTFTDHWWIDITSTAIAAFSMQLAWPVLTLATLMIFQGSMRRKGIKHRHLLRCVVYSADIMLWLALAFLFASLIIFITSAVNKIADPNDVSNLGIPQFLIGGTVGFWIISCCRLYTGYYDYLKFDYALGTIIASQIIVILSVPAILVLLGCL